jgi:hypothetical protein
MSMKVRRTGGGAPEKRGRAPLAARPGKKAKRAHFLVKIVRRGAKKSET